MEKKFVIIFTAITILLILNIALFVNLYLLVYKNSYEVIDTEPIEYYPSKEKEHISVEQAVELVNNHFKINYTLKFDSLQSSGLLGKTMPIINVVTIDNNLSGWEVISTLTHELCHIKYYTISETFTEFKTFVELYESNNSILKNRAEWLVYEHCVKQYRKYTDYDCSWYIIDYLNNKL